jgi:hypothetical protein
VLLYFNFITINNSQKEQKKAKQNKQPKQEKSRIVCQIILEINSFDMQSTDRNSLFSVVPLLLLSFFFDFDKYKLFSSFAK